jgi:hypothetical protein
MSESPAKRWSSLSAAGATDMLKRLKDQATATAKDLAVQAKSTAKDLSDSAKARALQLPSSIKNNLSKVAEVIHPHTFSRGRPQSEPASR